jgi:ATP-binding cassette, subfamily B, vacuolar membrane transporter HMT1/ACLQ
MEIVIGAVLESQQPLIPIPAKLVDTLFGLGMGRIFTLVLMAVSFGLQQYKLRPEAGSEDEGRSLLQNGNGSTNGYGGINGHASGAPSGKPGPQSKSVGWFDYFAGFKVLFPYLW